MSICWGGLALCAATLIFGCSPAGSRTARAPESPTTLSGETMGTSYTVKVVALPQTVELEMLRQEIQETLSRIDGLMSTYRAESEISRFNRYDGIDWFVVSPETASVVHEAVRLGELTEGAFDVTVGPLVNLWSFGPEKDSAQRVPSPGEIASVRQRVGFRNLAVRISPPALRKNRNDLYVDLSGIAKGFAVDQIAEHLDFRGIEDYMVEIGGEIRAKGHNHRGIPWRLAVESPLADRRMVHRVVSLENAAMATSGDYRNYFEKDGTRYCHIIDSRSGRPVAHGLASATVIGPSCSRADALATALMVLGPDAGFELAQREHLAVFLLLKTDTGFVEKSTAEFRDTLPP
ncbi:MAG: hypothetical protein A2V70_17065 [Planctomycetes bacterium RBG_13_63_9]|nr:MAG: hypothetical protein A2V70_17065 [Planctomycetes bacterium RBG_13_63_9]